MADPPAGVSATIVSKTAGETFEQTRTHISDHASITKSAIVNLNNVVKRQSAVCGGYETFLVDDQGKGQSAQTSLSLLAQPGSPVTVVDSASCQPITIDNSTSADPPTTESSGLSTGAIIGIAVGCAVGGIAIAAIIIIAINHIRKQRTLALAANLRAKELSGY